jgi:hypothetical protein
MDRWDDRWYCRTCWVNWFVKQESGDAVVAVTLHIARLEDSLLALSVINMAGDEVLKEVGLNGDATSVAALRKLLEEKVSFEERRLAPDGHFYTATEFDEWYASCGFDHPSNPWEQAEKLPRRPLELLLPNGARLLPCMDDCSINAALASAVSASAHASNEF